MGDDPLVSVIITTYRRPVMLKRAIDSVLEQTYQYFEIIVVDDNDPASADRQETEALMADYPTAGRIRYVRHERNRNGAAARNTGITESRGTFICFLDDDDWYYPEKLEKQVQFLKEHGQFDAVTCGWRRNGTDHLPPSTADSSFELLAGLNYIYTDVIMMRREAAIESGGWDERFRRDQDSAFMLRFFGRGFLAGAVMEVLCGSDVADRSNVPVARELHRQCDFYLKVHEDAIRRVSAGIPNGRSIILARRYRNVLAQYIKEKDWLGAIALYAGMTARMPLRFNAELASHSSAWINGKLRGKT